MAYAFQRDRVRYVVRFSNFLDDFAKDRWASRFASAALPTPAVTDLGTAFGGFYAISEWVAGSGLDQMDADSMVGVLPSLHSTLDAIRLVDVSKSEGFGRWGPDGVAGYSSWRDFLLDVANDNRGRTQGWRELLAASPTGCAPFEESFERLQAAVSFGPEQRHLVHGDPLSSNILAADGRVTAVLDWGCAMYADFLYDVAWFSFWAPWYPQWQGIDFAQEAARHYAAIGLEVPHFEERLQCCMLHIGLDHQAYNGWKGDWGELALVTERTAEVAH